MDAGISKTWINGVRPPKSTIIFKAPQRWRLTHFVGFDCAIRAHHAALR
jgi:hypothetical protein